MKSKNKLTFITFLYWILLLYIIIALAWWFISLEHQNTQMFNTKVAEIAKDNPHYDTQIGLLQEATYRKHTQYVGEGITFLLIILVGAVLLYRATKKQIQYSQQQQNFMMAVTHELKTPIAVMHLNLETIKKRKLDETQQEKLISSTLQEANRLNSLCSNILTTSQLESGEYVLNKELLLLSDLTNKCVDEYRARFPQRNFVTNITPHIYVTGEALLLQMLISNLIDNALKYSHKEAAVTISLYQEGNKNVLTIADEGNGISKSEKEKVFRQFYRIGSEQTRKTKGTGLGLYLCKKIVRYHKGHIEVKDNQPKGCIFVVKL